MVNNDWVTPDSIRTAVQTYRATLACNGSDPKREQLCDPSPYLTDGNDRKPFLGAIQPRVGLSYDVFGTGRTIVFGGYGMYYDRNRYGNALGERANLQWSTYTFQFSTDGLPRGGQPTTIWQDRYLTRAGLQEILASGSAPVPELFLTKNDTKPPMAHQFSAGVRQAFGDFGLSASYTGVRGYNTFTWIRANRNANGTCCTQFPSPTVRSFPAVRLDDDARNWYDALYPHGREALQRASRWGVQVAYTLGKAEERRAPGMCSARSTFFTVDDFERSPASTDERHHVTTNWIVGCRVGVQVHASSISDRSPLNATTLRCGTNNCTHGNQDCVSGNDWPTGKSRNWYRPDGDTFLGMDWWRYRNIDIRLEKSFRTVRGQQIGVIGELFNVFNFRNFTGYNTNVGDFNNTGGITPNGNFGRPTGVITDLTRMGAPRRVQLGMNYKF